MRAFQRAGSGYVARVIRLIRWILFAAGGTVLLAALALLAANIYLKTALSQEQIQGQLSRAINLPVSIKTVSFTPWGGVAVSGIAAPQPGEREGDFLYAKSFGAHVRLLPLFSKKVVIRELHLREPRLAWFQNAEGKWALPEKPKKVKEPKPEVKPKTQKAPQEKFAVVIEAVTVAEGDFVFYDAAGEPVVRFADVSVTSQNPSAAGIAGTFRATAVAVQEKITFRELTGAFQYAGGKLELDQLEASLAGGRVQGRLAMDLEAEGTPFDTAVRFSQVDAKTLLADAQVTRADFAGKLAGDIAARGSGSDAKTITGGGRITISEGEWRGFELLVTLAAALQIEELARLQLQQAEAVFALEDEKVVVESCTVATKNLALTGTGRIKFSGKLDLGMRLALQSGLAKQVPRMIADQFEKTADGGLKVDFSVKGSLNRPKTDLLDKVVGGRVEDRAVDLIKDILGFGGGGGRKEKTKEE